MHPPLLVREALTLIESGLSVQATARRLQLLRSTVRGWTIQAPVAQLAEAVDSRSAQWGFESLQGHLSSPEQQRAYAHLLGVYLGDGHIAHLARTYRLRLFQDARYPATAEAWAADLRLLLPRNRVHVGAPYRGCRVVSAYSTLLPRLFPQHGPGPKHLWSIQLTEEQEQVLLPGPFLRGLLHSDGTRYEERRTHGDRTYRYVQYAFTNASADIRGLALRAAHKLGLQPTAPGGRSIFFRRRADVARLEEIVGPKS